VDLDGRQAELPAVSNDAPGVDPSAQADARRHATLRFAAGVTAAFVASEALQWAPSFLTPVLVGVLLANLPMRPPLKLAVVLVLTMAAAALFAFAMASLLRDTPFVLFGLIGLCLFVAFHALVSGRQALPFIFLLICLTTIPVVVMVAPDQAGALPRALVRSLALALATIWIVYLPWSRPPPPKPAPAAATPSLATPEVRALLSTAVVLPVMLVYLLFGLADVLPVLIGTMILVVNFDLESGRSQAWARILANFVGGMLGLVLHAVLMTTPTLPFLALLLFPMLIGFGQRITAGGPAGSIAVITCNAMLIIFSSAIASGPGSLSLWLTRLFEFSLAGAFAVGMMTLVWHHLFRPHSAPPKSAAR
jgi:hypothetical protein